MTNEQFQKTQPLSFGSINTNLIIINFMGIKCSKKWKFLNMQLEKWECTW